MFVMFFSRETEFSFRNCGCHDNFRPTSLLLDSISHVLMRELSRTRKSIFSEPDKTMPSSVSKAFIKRTMLETAVCKFLKAILHVQLTDKLRSQTCLRFSHNTIKSQFRVLITVIDLDSEIYTGTTDSCIR
jgi:hypothetical protein